MYGKKIYSAEETVKDTHDDNGDIFFRCENGDEVTWKLARFGSESDKEAIRKIYDECFVRVNLVGGGKEYHRIKMCSISSAMYSLIGNHMGVDKSVVEKIIKRVA